MKKMMPAFILIICLLAGAAFAEAILPPDAVVLSTDGAVMLDLDGDGSNEKLSLRMKGVEYEAILEMMVEGQDGSVDLYETMIAWPIECLAVDMNGDGVLEILLSGDVASDDYFTWCLNYDTESGISAIPFADAGRGDNTDESSDSGYGKIVSLEGARLTLSGSQDVLGTWMSSRSFSLADGQFIFDDDGLWRMEDITNEEYVWDFFCLTTVRTLPVTLEDGSEATLPAGEKLVITASDKLTTASFVTRDGVKGSIALEVNEEEGWGHKIAGLADYEYFEYIPYAD